MIISKITVFFVFKTNIATWTKLLAFAIAQQMVFGITINKPIFWFEIMEMEIFDASF